MANRGSLTDAREKARGAAAGGRDRLEQNRNYRKSDRDNLHYQDAYGTIMTDEGFQAANQEQAAFNTEISKRRASVAEARKQVALEDTRARADLEGKRKEQQSAINSGFNLDIPGFSGGSNLNVNIPSWNDYKSDDSKFATVNFNGDQNYRIPHSGAQKLVEGIHQDNRDNQGGDDTYVGQDGNTINVYSKRGKEWHEGLNEAEREMEANYNAQVSVGKAKLEEGRRQQAAAKAAYDSQVRAAKAQAAEQKRQAQYTLDTSYNQGLTDIQGEIFIQTEKLSGIDQTTTMYVNERNKALQRVRDRYSEGIDRKKNTIADLYG